MLWHPTSDRSRQLPHLVFAGASLILRVCDHRSIAIHAGAGYKGSHARPIMPSFRKIAEDQIDQQRVTIALRKDAAGLPAARVVSMMVDRAGLTPHVLDLPPQEAVRVATDLAASLAYDGVDVVDPEDLWQSAWGQLDHT